MVGNVMTVGALNKAMDEAGVGAHFDATPTMVLTETHLVQAAAQVGLDFYTHFPTQQVSEGLMRAFVEYVRDIQRPPAASGKGWESKGLKKGHYKSKVKP